MIHLALGNSPHQGINHHQPMGTGGSGATDFTCCKQGRVLKASRDMPLAMHLIFGVGTSPFLHGRHGHKNTCMHDHICMSRYVQILCNLCIYIKVANTSDIDESRNPRVLKGFHRSWDCPAPTRLGKFLPPNCSCDCLMEDPASHCVTLCTF